MNKHFQGGIGLEFQGDTVITTPAPLMSWSKKSENQYSPEEITEYWKTNDIITFLADIEMYDATLYNTLNAAEKEHTKQFKSEYFKKRFTVSRSIFRHILCHIPGMEKNANNLLTRKKNGGIRVNNRQDLFISLSYSGSCVAVTLGKRKIGSDIESVRRREVRKIMSIPLFKGITTENGKDHDQHLLQVWTLLEAYAKFHDMSVYPLTQGRFFLPGTHFLSYLIDQRFIFSLASDTVPLKHTLLWIDPACRLTSSSARRKATGSLLLPQRDTYVRA